MKRFIFIFVSLGLCQCASFEKSVGLGVGIGAASGLTAAQMAGYNAKGDVVLALSGALIGGAVAAFLYHQKKDHEPATAPIAVSSGSPPPLKSAEKDVLWIPDRIDGDKFEEGHRIFVIKKPAHWQLKDGDKVDTDEEEEATNE